MLCVVAVCCPCCQQVLWTGVWRGARATIPEAPPGPSVGHTVRLKGPPTQGAKQSPVCSRLGTGHPDSPQPLGPAIGLTQHPNEQDGAVSTILCWVPTVPQTRHNGLAKPNGSTACISPSLGVPPSRSPASQGPMLGQSQGNKEVIKAGPKNQGWPIGIVHVLL